MKSSIEPIYRDQNAQFEIDSCAPQFVAMREGKFQLHALSKGHYPGSLLKKTQLPGITSLGFWNGVGAQDWGLEPHRNEGVEICFLETGNMSFSVEAKDFKLQPGDFTLTRPWQLHRLGAPNIGPGKLHWLILDVGVRRPNQDWSWPEWLTLTEADKAQLTRKLRHNANVVWKASPEIGAAFRGISDCILKWNKPHVESRTITHLNQLFLEILTVLTSLRSPDNPELTSRRYTVQLFLRDLAENGRSSSRIWTLEEMAAQCGMGITAFSKYCREQVNTSAMDYLNECRLDRAAQQLKKNRAASVTEIAFENGFNSSQYFATVFYQKFGMTPSRYRLIYR